MSIGIAFSVKSNLGVSPVSSIPYTITLITGLEMGKATIVFHIFLIILQILILRKDFDKKNLLQLFVAFIFGYFTTFSNYLLSFVPPLQNYIIKLVFLLISILCVGIGIFLYMSGDIIPLAGEGVMYAVSTKYSKDFSKVKICFDVSMVVISSITCIIFIHNLGSVREGTIISSILVGSVLGLVTKMYKDKLDNFLTSGNSQLTINN